MLKISTSARAALKWTGTAAGVAGAFLVAANVPLSGWGFALFLLNSLPWLIVGLWRRDWALAVQFLGFSVANMVGVWRWLV